MYGRITNGAIEIAPNYIVSDNQTIINPTAEAYLAAGYKPIVETDGNGVPSYTETENAILQTWTSVDELEPNDPITDLELAVCGIFERLEALDNG